jgi:hypothetical protein
MRVQKAKEIKEVDIKAEKDMIELTIPEAAENIEKYQKETRAWKDRKVVRKDIKTGDLVLKRKKNWENPGNFKNHGKVLSLKISKVVRFIFQHFLL